MQKLVFGEYDGTLSPRVRQFRDACLAGGIEVEVSERIEAVWEKFVFLVGLSGTTSTARSTIGPIREPLLTGLLQRTLQRFAWPRSSTRRR